MVIKIEKMVQGFYGLGHLDDKTVFVEDALPDEVLDISIIKENKNILFAKVNKIIKESEKRIKPFCPLFKECGGCDVQSLSYSDELDYKSKIILENIKRIAKKDVSFTKPIAYSNDKNYRIRCKFSYLNNNFGFKKRNSNDVVNINNCPLLVENINSNITSLSKNKSDVNVLSNTKELTTDDKVIAINLLDKDVYASSKVFFQSNIKTTEILLNDIKTLVKGNTIVDLYSGVGLFSKFIEDENKNTYCIEKNKYCLLLSKKHLKYSKFFTKDVKDFKINKSVDTLIVDPPRIGLDKIVISTINKIKPTRLIYVSCESTTFARDLQRLNNIGYEISFLRAYDFYPHTKHTETMCMLERK